jgi:hypothetical protein
VRRELREIVSERFLLRGAERRATSATPEHRARIRFLLRSARARQRAAAGLRSPEEAAPAFRLLLEAFKILATAHAVARGEHDSDETLDERAALGVLAPPDGAPEHGATEALLADPDPLAADRLTTAEALRMRPELERLLGWLERGLEVRTVRRIRVARWLRLGLAALALASLSIAAVAWALAPTNLARGKPVSASSRFPRTPDPSGATDGVRGRGFGVHTVFEPRPWVAIDLGQVHALKEVVVFHRSDNHQLESLPLTLELSEDGSSYSEVATRSTLFTAEDPWRQRLDGKRARWVRLIVNKKPKGYIALSEIEVYGR